MYSFVNLSLHSSFNEHRSCNFLEKKKHCWNQQTGVWTSWQKVALWMLKALAWNGFHQLSSPAPSHFQQVNLSFYTLAFLWLWQRLYCWCSPQDFDVCDEVGIMESVAPFRNLCVKVKHLISRKFVLAQTATITIWELSQNGTKILRRTTSITAFFCLPWPS